MAKKGCFLRLEARVGLRQVMPVLANGSLLRFTSYATELLQTQDVSV